MVLAPGLESLHYRGSCIVGRRIGILEKGIEMKYMLAIYEDSFAYEESYRVESNYPFPAISIGEKWDPSLNGSAKWNSPISADESLIALDIEHEVSSVNGLALHSITKIKVGKISRANW